MEWWRSQDAVLELARWLDERGDLDSIADALYVIEKPQKWTPEYRAMRAEQTREVTP